MEYLNNLSAWLSLNFILQVKFAKMQKIGQDIYFYLEYNVFLFKFNLNPQCGENFKSGLNFWTLSEPWQVLDFYWCFDQNTIYLFWNTVRLFFHKHHTLTLFSLLALFYVNSYSFVTLCWSLIRICCEYRAFSLIYCLNL